MRDIPLDHKTIAYEARHRTFPMLGVSKPTRAAAELFIRSRPFPADWKLVRLIDVGPGGIVIRELPRS